MESPVDKLSTVRMPGPMVRGFLWLRHALKRLRARLTPANANVIERTLPSSRRARSASPPSSM